MKRILKWIGIGLGGLFGLLAAVAVVLALLGSRKVNQDYAVQPEAVTIREDAAVLERGHYLVSVSCTGCHGENLAGTEFFNDPALGAIPAPNLTAGQGGIGASFSDADFVRAIRHGIDNQGKPLIVMPADAFWHYSDDDLAAIIAYVKNAAPVDNDPGPKTLRPVGLILVGAGILDVLAAEHIDHTGPRPAAPAQQVDAAYGAYLINANGCRGCHGPDLSGGPSDEPGAPPGPNLTAAGELGAWTRDEFLTVFRTGVKPDGRQLNPEYMPWDDVGHLNDDDLTAIFFYLQSLPTAVTTTE